MKEIGEETNRWNMFLCKNLDIFNLKYFFFSLILGIQEISIHFEFEFKIFIFLKCAIILLLLA